MINPPQEDQNSYDLQTQVFKILTHPARLEILDILRDGEHCVCHLEAYLGYRQAYISQQLSVLRDAGLVVDRREGWNIFYRVADERIYDLLDAVRQITGQVGSSIRQPIKECKCPQCSQKSANELK